MCVTSKASWIRQHSARLDPQNSLFHLLPRKLGPLNLPFRQGWKLIFLGSENWARNSSEFASSQHSPLRYPEFLGNAIDTFLRNSFSMASLISYVCFHLKCERCHQMLAIHSMEQHQKCHGWGSNLGRQRTCLQIS